MTACNVALGLEYATILAVLCMVAWIMGWLP